LNQLRDLKVEKAGFKRISFGENLRWVHLAISILAKNIKVFSNPESFQFGGMEGKVKENQI
jgi:hypothetical protein